jgi:hypothetical protein
MSSSKGGTMKWSVVFALGLTILWGSTTLLAQQTAATSTVSDQDIQLMRKDLQSDKKSIVAANMSLTDKEAEQFWPVYDQYAADLMKINDAKVSVIKDYAANYNNLSDIQAQDLAKRWTDADEKAAQLRMQYLAKFEKVLPGQKVARFFQVDHRIATVMDLQMASQIPLVTP